MLDRLDDVLNLMVDKKYDSADKLLANMLATEKNADNVEKIKTFRRLIANKILKENNQFRSDAMYYLIHERQSARDLLLKIYDCGIIILPPEDALRP